MTKYLAYLDKKVNGLGPIGADILAVGESPGNDEVLFGEPFVGRAGVVLNNCLSRHGIPREIIRIENLCNIRPWNDRFENVLGTPFLQSGIRLIHEYILSYRPIVIAALGNYPMHYLTGKGKKAKGSIIGIGNWRGSILPYVDDQGNVHEDIKVIPLYHPAAVSRSKGLYPIFDADIKRVKEESKFRGLNYDNRTIITNPPGLKLISEVEKVLKSDTISIDIESIKGTTIILTISFSISPYHALVLPIKNNERYISEILSSSLRKIFHFGYFDTTMLKLNGFYIAQDEISKEYNTPYFWDTYLASHVIDPEMPHTLAFEVSMRTRMPYYKQEGKEESDQKGWSRKVDLERLMVYNGKDTCGTFEVFLGQLKDLQNSDNINTFQFEMSAIEMQTHISDSGMLIDKDRFALLKGALITRWAKLQYLLDGVSGFEVNVRSPKLKDWLYNKATGLGLPTRSVKTKVTTNDDALVSLLAWCKSKVDESIKDETKKKYRVKYNIIRAIREIRNLRQRYSMYMEARISDDGRSRSSYKYGPDTGRWAAQKYVDGSGYNHQTNPRDPIEVLDEDYEKYKNDARFVNDIEKEEDDDE